MRGLSGDDEPVPAFGLRSVEGVVGAFSELVGGLEAVPQGQPDGAGDPRRQGCAQALDRLACGVDGGVWQGCAEFVAADATDEVDGAQVGGQLLSDRLQQLVAGAVAGGVVELLETVEIDQRDGQPCAAAPPRTVRRPMSSARVSEPRVGAERRSAASRGARGPAAPVTQPCGDFGPAPWCRSWTRSRASGRCRRSVAEHGRTASCRTPRRRCRRPRQPLRDGTCRQRARPRVQRHRCRPSRFAGACPVSVVWCRDSLVSARTSAQAVNWAAMAPPSSQTFSRLMRPARNSKTCSMRKETCLPRPGIPRN